MKLWTLWVFISVLVLLYPYFVIKSLNNFFIDEARLKGGQINLNEVVPLTSYVRIY